MATNIPPHNLGELVDGILAIIDNKDIEILELMNYIKGPDFPTGAIIDGRAGIIEAYKTGRGKIKVRGKIDIEELKNGKSNIIVSEIPYQLCYFFCSLHSLTLKIKKLKYQNLQNFVFCITIFYKKFRKNSILNFVSFDILIFLFLRRENVMSKKIA